MILVTGGTGLVGSHLLYELLQENDKIVAIHRKSSDLQYVKHIFSFYTEKAEALFSKIQWVEADITDVFSLQKAFEGVTQVYHASALVSFNLKDYRLLRKINIEGTKNIVNLCIDFQIKKLCFVSSIASLGSNYNKKYLDENDEWDNEKNVSGYAITKHGAEMEVMRASQEGLEVVIVNPGVILGAGFWNKGSSEMFEKVHKGMPFYTTGITGYIYVKDVVKSMIFLMKSPIKNERFILVSENKSFKDIFDTIADELQKKRPSFKITKPITELAWRIFSFLSFFTRKSPLLNKQTAHSIQEKTYYSSEKINKIVPFTFTPIQKAIEEICRIYKEDLVKY